MKKRPWIVVYSAECMCPQNSIKISQRDQIIAFSLDSLRWNFIHSTNPIANQIQHEQARQSQQEL